MLWAFAPGAVGGQAGQGPAIASVLDRDTAALPDAPGAQTPASSPPPKPAPCSPGSAATSQPPATSKAFVAASEPAAAGTSVSPPPCPPKHLNAYERFVNGPQERPLRPKDKAWLAARNVADPFNSITILGEAGVAIAADSHTAYGPGFPGWGRNVGVSYTQDITGEFFGTFLIPSLTHQDPHYHRMEGRAIPRRVIHAISQVVWTQSDRGKAMLNYANLVGFAIDDEISNLYVPGRQTDAPATAARYATGLATAPIDNFVTEFLPDVARHIHVEIVVLQRIINQVALKEPSESGGQTGGQFDLKVPVGVHDR